jgi:thymidylate kinase
MIHSEYKSIFSALDGAGLPCCLLRDDINHGDLVGDLDLLVRKPDFGKAIEVLVDLGFRVRTSARLVALKSVLVKWVDGEVLAIDLHAEVVQDGIVFLNGDRVIQRCQNNGEYNLPCDADMLVILFLHNVLGKECIQDKHYTQIKSLSKLSDSHAISDATMDSRLDQILLPLIADLDRLYEDKGMVVDASRSLRAYLGTRDRKSRFRSLMQKFWRFVRDKGLRQRAPMYAFTGVDGVGKSSLTAEFVDAINRCPGFKGKVMYMGPWGHYRLPLVKGELYVPGWSLDRKEWLRLIRERDKKSSRGLIKTCSLITKSIKGQELDEHETADYKSIRENSILFLTLRYMRSIGAATWFLLTLSIEMYYRYYRAYRLRRRGVTVIADRYIYDLMTGRMHEMIPQYRRLRSWICAVYPKPTKVFLLSNDPETILERKRDLSEEMLVKHLGLYLEMAEKYGFSIVETTKPAKDLAIGLLGEQFDEIVKFVKM